MPTDNANENRKDGFRDFDVAVAVVVAVISGSVVIFRLWHLCAFLLLFCLFCLGSPRLTFLVPLDSPRPNGPDLIESGVI